MAVNLKRKEVEVARKRVPLTKIFDGNDFATALAELKKFRVQFAEQEILFKAKVYFSFSYGEATAIVRREETDGEYCSRVEAERKAEADKAERKRVREEKARLREEVRQRKALAEAETKRLEEIKTLKELARKLKLTAKDFAELDS